MKLVISLFVSVIPHDFGIARPPLLDNVELIKTKTEMIDNLLEIEIAYSMLDESNNTIEGTEHPIDGHYKKLKCGLEPVDPNSEEFYLIEQYMTKTHTKTHDQYSLKLRDLFKAARDGEADRFKNFQTLDNHQLLWHGSRTTNFAGILSQGLRIAPPEAPVVSFSFFPPRDSFEENLLSFRQVICLAKVFILLIWFPKAVSSHGISLSIEYSNKSFQPIIVLQQNNHLKV